MMLRLKALLLAIAIGILATLPQVTQAHVSPPHIFVGTALVDNSPASSGTVVSAWADGVQIGRTIMSESGRYAIGVNQPGSDEPVSFKIGGQLASESSSWIRGGATVLDLTTISYINTNVPPHILVGTARIDGQLVQENTIVTAWVGSLPVASGIVRDGRYVIKAPQPLSGEALTFTVGDFYTTNQTNWQLGGSTVLNLNADPSIVSLRLAVCSIGGNLERVFSQDAQGNWTFYDPRAAFADTNTLTIINPGQTYWIKVEAKQNVVLGNKLRRLQPGLNEIVW